MLNKIKLDMRMLNNFNRRLAAMEKQVGKRPGPARGYADLHRPGETTEEFFQVMAGHNPEGAAQLKGLFETARERKRMAEGYFSEQNN